MNPTLTILDTPPDDPAILRAWRQMARTPMQTPEWMLAWWQVYGDEGVQLHAPVVRDQNRIIAIAPFYLRSHRFLGNELRFLADQHVCSDFQSILYDDDAAASSASVLTRWLTTAEMPRRLALVTWDGLDPSCATIQRVMADLRIGDYLVERETIAHTWRIPTSDGWRAVLENMSRTGRRQSRNLLNRLDRGTDFSVQWAASLDTVERGIRTGMGLHYQQWLISGCTDSCSDGRLENFLLRAARGLVPQGMMEVGLLQYQHQTVAALITLVDSRGNRYFYQTGRLPSANHLSPGRMLFLAAIRRACELGVAYVDFLRGDELYKRRFAATPTPCHRAQIIPPNRISRLYHRAWVIGRGLKHYAADGMSAFAEPIPTVT